MTTIIQGSNHNYLSEFLTDLPDNVILNKVTTGCGMTSLAISTDRKYVIAVPYTNIILSKLNDNILGVYAEEESGVTYQDIINYTGSKIICTYDSLEKVTSALKQRGDLLEWKVLIDECQKLVDAGSFRGNAIRGVLNSYKEYGSFIFGTATPVRDEYQLPELTSIPKATISWNGLLPVSVYHGLYEGKLNEVVATKALTYLEGYKKQENAHFFINSVQDIIQIIRFLKRNYQHTEIDTRIVCANTKTNEARLLKDLGSKYSISSINSKVKKVNFYTATAFEGCDIFDANGRTFIVSNGSKDYCKIDILTTLPQIIGRIRNSLTKNEVELIYTSSSYTSAVSEEEYSATVKQKLKDVEATVSVFNTVDPTTKEILLAGSASSNYLLNINNELKVNDTAWYSEMNAFHTLRELYYVNPRTGLCELDNTQRIVNGIEYNYEPKKQIDITGLVKSKLGKVPNFSDLCKDYFTADNTQREFINKVEPIIEEAFNTLGQNKMEALNCQKGKIKKELLLKDNMKGLETKIITLLGLEVGKFYSLVTIKESLQVIYADLGIIKTAKASDLNQWYSVKNTMRRVDSLPTKGIAVITCNIK